MPVIQSSVSIAGNAVNDNILDGSQYEVAPWDAFVEFGLVGDVNGADLRIDVYSGTDLLAENMIPSIANRTPLYPDDFPLNDAVGAGEKIKVRVRNVNVAARTLFFSVKFTPLF